MTGLRCKGSAVGRAVSNIPARLESDRPAAYQTRYLIGFDRREAVVLYALYAAVRWSLMTFSGHFSCASICPLSEELTNSGAAGLPVKYR
jgi:hypothetical protein